MFSRTSRLLSLLFLEFSGFYILFSFQGSLLFLNSNSFILSQLVVFVNNFFNLFFEVLSSFNFYRNQRCIKFYHNSHPVSTTFLKILLFLGVSCLI